MYLLLFANVQIMTRLLGSACPCFHWYLTSLLFHRGKRELAQALKLYLLLFNLLGVAMHVNFLPWT